MRYTQRGLHLRALSHQCKTANQICNRAFLRLANINGQWVGRYTGTNSGLLVIELDDMSTHYEGSAYAYDDNPALASAFASIKTPSKDTAQTVEVQPLPIDRNTMQVISWDELEKTHPGIAFPRTAEVSFRLDGDSLAVSARTSIGTTIDAVLPRTRAGEATEYVPSQQIVNWRQFKEQMVESPYGQFIFRGQSEPKRLRTSFHRSGRADISRFQREDVPTLLRHLTARTKHVFNLAVPDEYGAFMNLVQHHGYPTPLLDWTRSPFVAAFFAYRGVTAKDIADNPDGKVRIFVFDKVTWTRELPQVPLLRAYGPNLSILEFIAIENERLVPQQSVSTVTNVDDVESYIRLYERSDRRNPLLQIIDLPLSERSAVMRELGLMGITAGSLFPGLDGACEELRERLFTST